MPGYPIQNLKQFSPALIYGFEPEASPAALGGSQALKDAYYPQISQHEDMLSAYLYAQDEILPWFKNNGMATISGEQIEAWIKAIHTRIAKTLLGMHDHEAGIYAESPVFRWHTGGMVQTPVLLFLSRVYFPMPSLDEFVRETAKEHKLDPQVFKAFMQTLLRLEADATIELSESQRRCIPRDEPHGPGVKVLSKLQAAYYGDLLTAPEKAAVEKIVKICMPSDRYPEVMREYCENIAKKLKELDRTNTDEVVEFVADLFLNFVEIHPFPNGNGRTGTCMMNAFLRVSGLPSILLRYPKERDNPNSSYSKIFEQPEVNRERLIAHIKSRVADELRKPYQNKVLEKTILLRTTLLSLFRKIEQLHPTFDLNKAYQASMSELSSPNLMPLIMANEEFFSTIDPSQYEEAMAIIYLQFILAKMQDTLKELNLKKAARTQPTSKNIIAKLVSLSDSDASNWKAYQKGKIILFECTDGDLRDTIYERLLAYKQAKSPCFTLLKTRRKDNHNPVIRVTNVNAVKLFTLIKKDSPLPPIAEAVDSKSQQLASA